MVLRRLKMLPSTNAAWDLGDPAGPYPVIEIDDITGEIFAAQSLVSLIRKVTVTAQPAQLKAMYGFPVTLVPAPGMNKILVFHHAVVQYKHHTTIYTTPPGDSLIITLNLPSNNTPVADALSSVAMVGFSSNKIETEWTPTRFSDQDDPANTANQALYLSHDTAGEWTNGDGILVMTVYYSVIDLA